MLTVPLQCHRKPLNGKEGLLLWQNGKQIHVKAPINPYVISLSPITFNDIEYDLEELQVRPLGTTEYVNGYKYSFPLVDRINELNRQLSNFPSKKHLVRENHMVFVMRCAVDAPDFFLQYPEKLESKLCFDIETLSDGRKYHKDIIAIAVSDGKDTWSHIGKETDILENFIQDWKNIDPDIVITYNGKNFDLPSVIRRCEHYGIATDWVTRDGSSPRFVKDVEDRIHQIAGRCMFDVYEDVLSDQMLGGIKNKRLKTVAAWFNIPAITEDTSDTSSLLKDPDRLRAYCESDVNATMQLSTGYLYQQAAIVNKVIFPFDNLINPRAAEEGMGKGQTRSKAGYSSTISKLVFGRGMLARNCIENGPNDEKHPEEYRLVKEWNRTHSQSDQRKVFQGALPQIYRPGYHKDILHVDYKSMYPNILISSNISPETVSLVALEPYDESADFLRETSDDYNIFCIPDKNLMLDGRNAIIRVDTSYTGCTVEFLLSTNADRAVFKDEMEVATNELDRLILKSQQSGMKVLVNASGFGTNTFASMSYGDLYLGVLCTGTSRHMLGFAEDWLAKNDLPPIEDDTDGIFVA